MYEYFRAVQSTGVPILVTEDGVPVLQVISYRQKKSIEELFSPYWGKTKTALSGDVEGGIGEDWEESIGTKKVSSSAKKKKSKKVKQ